MMPETAAGALDLLFLLGADELDLAATDAFVVYLGTHGDAGAHRADVILPGAAYTEKSGLYVNTEGRVQLARHAVFPPGDAREDWAIIRALSEALGKTLPYNNLRDVRAGLIAANPIFAHIDELVPAPWGAFGKEGPIDPAPFVYPIADFYRTDPISRASPTMAACVDAITAKTMPERKTGTHD